jgi:hypothetical protein
MAREEAAENEAESVSFAHRLLQRSREISGHPSPVDPRLAADAAVARPDA